MTLADLNSASAAALAIWADVCSNPHAREAAWITEPEVATMVPFDSLTIVKGVLPIVEHLHRRDRNYGAANIQARPVACWVGAASFIVVAEAALIHTPPTGTTELRRMTLVVAAVYNEGLRLKHVTEAMPAVLPLVIESYRRRTPRQSRI